jgi:bifunctional non-homologous end joining protein LigD
MPVLRPAGKTGTLCSLTKDEMPNCQWLKLLVVAQIEFQEWTPDGHLRHASFAGLRNDKKPSRKGPGLSPRPLHRFLNLPCLI